MEKSTKSQFFNSHKYKDMIKYRKRFLNEVKARLPYFVQFSENGSMLSKVYPQNCAVKKMDEKLIIMITYNKKIFLANNR